jgi:hypothetical protein
MRFSYSPSTGPNISEYNVKTTMSVSLNSPLNSKLDCPLAEESQREINRRRRDCTTLFASHKIASDKILTEIRILEIFKDREIMIKAAKWTKLGRARLMKNDQIEIY